MLHIIKVKLPSIRNHVQNYSTTVSTLPSTPSMVMKIPVGNTSLWVAHCRALECQRSDPIVKDKFAEILSGKEGKEIYDHYAKFLKMSGPNSVKFQDRMIEEFNDSIVSRCRYYDDLALSKSERNCKQVVILASGLDSRAFRLNWSPNVSIFEVDRKEVLNFKFDKLKQIIAKPTCHKHIPIDADLTEPSWPQKMKDHGIQWLDVKFISQGFNTEAPTLWLVEGLLGYIPEEGVRKLLQTCSNLSPSGSCIGGDVSYLSFLLNKVPMFQEAKRLGNPFLFQTNSPEKLFQGCGWPNAKVNQKGDPDMKYSRFKKNVIPRWVPFYPRNFFVQATK